MRDLEEEVLRRLLVDLFLAAPRRRTPLEQNSQEGTRKKSAPSVRQKKIDNQTGDNHDEKEEQERIHRRGFV
jgi:hypothetical protein